MCIPAGLQVVDRFFEVFFMFASIVTSEILDFVAFGLEGNKEVFHCFKDLGLLFEEGIPLAADFTPVFTSFDGWGKRSTGIQEEAFSNIGCFSVGCFVDWFGLSFGSHTGITGQ